MKNTVPKGLSQEVSQAQKNIDAFKKVKIKILKEISKLTNRS